MDTNPVHPLLKEMAGLRLLMLLALVLLVVTIWTYSGLAGVSLRRSLALFSLRLAALAVALLALLRPSLAFTERHREPGVLYVAVDASESMMLADEEMGGTRWDALCRDLAANAPEFERLRREDNIETVFVRFGDGIAEFLPGQPGKADLQRSDTEEMLRTLMERRAGKGRAAALFVLSDGADTGNRTKADEQALKWRQSSCPVHTFAYGNPNAGEPARDVEIDRVISEPRIPVGDKLNIRVKFKVSGYNGQPIRLRMVVEDKKQITDREMVSKVVTLGAEPPEGYELTATAPTTEGEYRVTVIAEDPNHRDQPLPGEVSATNNRQSIYVHVVREGIQVLIIDKRRGWEPQGIYDALGTDRRINRRMVTIGNTNPQDKDDPLELDTLRPDVVILGDVSPAQLRTLRPDAVERLAQMVQDSDHPLGLIVLGGYASFGNSDWSETALGKLFPCKDRGVKGQLEDEFWLQPTDEGLAETTYRSLLKLRDGDQDSAEAWRSLPTLYGLSRMGDADPTLSFVLANAVSKKTQEKLPALVASTTGRGRVLAFAGTTTYRWRSKPQGRDDHARFWKQLVAWVANQQETDSTVRVALDTPDHRRLRVRREIPFNVQLFGKGGRRLEEVRATMEVTDANGKTQERPTSSPGSPGELRGRFAGAVQPGEYLLKVTATANDPANNGKPVTGTNTIRFMVYDDDVEATHRIAEHEALKSLAESGGGRFYARPADDLSRVLRNLQTLAESTDRRLIRPDWSTRDTSLFLMAYVALFAGILAAEWGLRRRWGLI